ncbi:MAG: tetratricopeptide repeat protein [Candidatus Kapabacteria bacterium]|nr:tetratricopeptide repeat protein [Candidatus Kapabacteria bacterium]
MSKLQSFILIFIVMLWQSPDCQSSDFTKSVQNRLEFNDYDKAFQIVTTHKKNATRSKDTLQLIKANNAQGLIYKHMDKHEIARAYFEEAAFLSRTIGYARGEYACYVNLGNSYELDGKYDPAIEFLNLAYEKAVEMNDSVSMAKAYMAIGNVYYAIDEYENAERHYIDAYALSVGDTTFFVKLFINTAVNAIEMQAFHKAQNLLQTADECCVVIQDRIDIKLAQGELALKRNEVEISEKYFQEAIRLSEMTADVRREGYGYYGLGRLLMSRNFEKSENHLKNAYRAFESIKATIDMVKANNALFELYMTNKKYTHAALIMKNMSDLVNRPKVTEPGMANLLNRVAEQHETKIELENALAEEKLKTQRRTFISLIGIIVVVFIALCVFFHYRRITMQTLTEASNACESRRLIKQDLELNQTLQNKVKTKAIEINAYADVNNKEHLRKIKQNAIDIVTILDNVNGN